MTLSFVASHSMAHKCDCRHINNTREQYDFFFNQIMNIETTQDNVFDGCAVDSFHILLITHILNRLAKDHCDSALGGINSTIFAYGQVHLFICDLIVTSFHIIRVLASRQGQGKLLQSLAVQRSDCH